MGATTRAGPSLDLAVRLESRSVKLLKERYRLLARAAEQLGTAVDSGGWDWDSCGWGSYGPSARQTAGQGGGAAAGGGAVHGAGAAAEARPQAAQRFFEEVEALATAREGGRLCQGPSSTGVVFKAPSHTRMRKICVLNRQRGLTLARPTATPAATLFSRPACV